MHVRRPIVTKISSNFTLHLIYIKVGKVKQFKKVSCDFKTILMTDLADLQFLRLSVKLFAACSCCVSEFLNWVSTQRSPGQVKQVAHQFGGLGQSHALLRQRAAWWLSFLHWFRDKPKMSITCCDHANEGSLLATCFNSWCDASVNQNRPKVYCQNLSLLHSLTATTVIHFWWQLIAICDYTIHFWSKC